eukprot:3993980-Pyramimonas_sp.AAC.1
MIDSPLADITSNARGGYANIHAAATCPEAVRALGPAMRNSGRTVKVIASYAAQRTVLHGGWPQGKSGFWKNAALAESRQGKKSQGTTAASEPNPPGQSSTPFSQFDSQPRAVSARTRSAPLARASGLGTD